MAYYRPSTKSPEKFKLYFKVTITSAVIVLLLSIIIYQVFLFFNRTKAEKYFSQNQNIAILLSSSYGKGKKRISNFCTVAILVPSTKRIGFITFYPQMRLSSDDSTLQDRIAKNGLDDIRSDIEDYLHIDISFFIEIDPKQIAKAIDLIQGVPYFILSENIAKKEKLPSGEFTFDGSFISRYLQTGQNKRDMIDVRQLYRYYSLGLNFWQVRQQKWNILKVHEIFKQASDGLNSNLSETELYFFAEKLFSDKGWLPMFIELPVKREKDKIFIDKQHASLYIKRFLTKINSTKHPYLNRAPKLNLKNGTAVPSLARKMHRRIRRKGVRVMEFTNADRNNYSHTFLVDMSANVYFLESVAKLIKIERYYHSINKALLTDLNLILGQDYRKLDFSGK